MIPTSHLNPLGQKFERQFLLAWSNFETERFDEANAISRSLVREPLIGHLHKAGCHLILAHSPDDYVYHAEQALWLFENLYPDPRAPPDEEQRRSQEELVGMARRVLGNAREDAKRYADRSDDSGLKEKKKKMKKPPGYTPLQRMDTQKLRSILEERRNCS